MRPKASAILTRKQFKKQQSQGMNVRTITIAIESFAKASKSSREEWKSIGDSPAVLNVWDESYGNDLINLNQDSNEYVEHRDELDVGTDRFFLGASGY